MLRDRVSYAFLLELGGISENEPPERFSGSLYFTI
jgi:hypothetical protein